MEAEILYVRGGFRLDERAKKRSQVLGEAEDIVAGPFPTDRFPYRGWI
jgi:hypothetical protein